MPADELRSLLVGYGYEPTFVEGDEPAAMHQAMAAALDAVLDEIAAIRHSARCGKVRLPRCPMIVLRSPKGWTGPKAVDGKPVEGTWRSHQVPVAATRENPEHRAILEDWMRSYRPEELFAEDGSLVPELARLGTEGAAAHLGQPARQRAQERVLAAAGPAGLRRPRAGTRPLPSRGHPHARRLPAGGPVPEQGRPQLPDHGSR